MKRRSKEKLTQLTFILYNAKLTAGEVYILLKRLLPSKMLVSRKTIFNWFSGFPDIQYKAIEDPEKLIKDTLIEPGKDLVELPSEIVVNKPKKKQAYKKIANYQPMPLIIDPDQLKSQIQWAFVKTLMNQDKMNTKYEELVSQLAMDIDGAVVAHQYVLDDYNNLEEKPTSPNFKPPLPMAEYRAMLTNQLGKAMKPLTEGHKAFMDMAYDIDLKFDNSEYKPKEDIKDTRMMVTVKEVIE